VCEGELEKGLENFHGAGQVLEDHRVNFFGEGSGQ
jgi:hypothetical protein